MTLDLFNLGNFWFPSSSSWTFPGISSECLIFISRTWHSFEINLLLASYSPQCNWGLTDKWKLYIFMWYKMMFWFILLNDYHKLTKISIISGSYHFFLVLRTFTIYSLRKFQVYNAVLLSTVTIIYITSPALTHPEKLKLCTLWPFLQSPHPSAPGKHHSILFFYEFDF